MGRRLVTAVWPIAGAAALLWPSVSVSMLDGVPLDRATEAIVIALVIPALWWLHPRFFRSRAARIAIVLLLFWKLAAPLILTQQGWCGRFIADGEVPLTWDARADWRQPSPQCSTIVARPFASRDAFPAWFLHINERMAPPVTLEFLVKGHLTASERGVLALNAGAGQDMTIQAGADRVEVSVNQPGEIVLPAGVHSIDIRMRLSPESPWRFEPRWNGNDLWSSTLTTVATPTSADRAIGMLTRVITPLIAGAIVVMSAVGAFRALRPTGALIAWAAGASIVMAIAGSLDGSGRFAIVLLLAAAAIPLPARLGTLRGVFLLLGLPWLALFAARSIDQIGMVTAYNPGDDAARYQLFAHRIFMEGRWLEGGSPTLWVQPLYRWLAGSLHVLFGDSSAGELYVDVASMLAGVLLSAAIVRQWAGFRWGVIAGAVTAITFVMSPTWWLIGLGLAEPSAAGFVYLTALLALRGRRGSIGWTIAAAVMAVLAFYSRMNHLPLVVAMAVLLLPGSMHAGDRRVTSLFHRARWSRPVIFLGILAIGVALLALRTWYYTGIFSVVEGTQYQLVATGLGPAAETPIERIPHVLGHAWISLSRFATFDQPSIFNVRAAVMVAGIIAIVLAAVRVPVFRNAPLGLVIVGLGGLAAPALVFTGAYPGRTSLHFVPFAAAMCVGTLASFWRARSAALEGVTQRIGE